MKQRSKCIIHSVVITVLVALCIPGFANSPTSDYLKELKGRFARTSEGTIHDCKTGLIWRESPDVAMTWNQAQAWIKSLGKPWRTPTIEELQGIYQAESTRKGQPLMGLPMLDLHLDPAFLNNSYMVWSKVKDSATAWYFGFYDGVAYWYHRDATIWRFRAFAVSPAAKKAGNAKNGIRRSE